MGGALSWDYPALLENVIRSLVDSAPFGIRSVGIDTWGLDFGLLDEKASLLEWPVSYRDLRTEGVMEAVTEHFGRETIYRRTGIQFLSGNTVYQLAALAAKRPELLDKAQTLLMMPDLLFYHLTGNISTEYTIASTTQLINCTTRGWDDCLISEFGLPRRIFTNLVSHGYSCLLSADLAGRHLLERLPVIKVASHDTASAVISVPDREKNFAYISSGTWSVIGTELTAPVIDLSRTDWSNEAGQGGTVRYCRSLMGMWILEECRSQLPSLKGLSYGTLMRLAEEAAPFRSLIDPQFPVFGTRCDIIGEIQRYCRESGQPVPETPGQFLRCIFESTALNYACGFEELCRSTSVGYDRLYIVGGGSRNGMINQMTANAISREVIAGPAEATVFGNLFAQLDSVGKISGISQYREMLSGSEGLLSVYHPEDGAVWRSQLERFKALIEAKNRPMIRKAVKTNEKTDKRSQ